MIKCDTLATEYGCKKCIYIDKYSDIGRGCCLTAMETAYFHNKKIYPHNVDIGLSEEDIIFTAPDLSFIERMILNIRVTIAVNRYLRENGYPRVYFVKIIKGECK